MGMHKGRQWEKIIKAPFNLFLGAVSLHVNEQWLETV